MSLELISALYEVPNKTKTTKYRRFKNEKRVKRVPGVKRIQTEKWTTTKWEPEIANKKMHEIGRKRAREDKYCKWDDNRTTSCCEDKKNEMANLAMRERLRAAALERRLSDYTNLLFPVYHLKDRMSWPAAARESYYEQKEVADAEKFEMQCKSYEDPTEYKAIWDAILYSPEQLAINAANDAHNAEQVAIYGDR